MGKQFSSVVLISFLSGFSGPLFSQGIGLEEAIREVCAKSDSVKMMRESVKKSEEMVREKWSNALPVISATAYAARNRGSLFGGSGGSSSGSSSREVASASTASALVPAQQKPALTAATFNDSVQMALAQILPSMFSSLSQPQLSTIYSTSLQVSQPLFTFGKIGTAIAIAKDFDQAAKYTYVRNLQNLQLQAFDAFSRAVVADKAAEIAAHSFTRKKELNGFLSRNFDLGAGSKAQVLATKADVANQSSSVLIAKRDARTARMVLNAFMARQLTDSSALDTASTLRNLLDAPLTSQDDAVVTALANRADLKSFKLMAEATKGGVKIYKAMYLPSIAATGSVGYSKYESGSQILSSSGMGNWTIGIAAQWTLFDGFANSARAAQYLSDANKLDLACNTMSKMVEIDARAAVAECAAADSNYAASKEMFGSAHEGYELTESDFKQGSGRFADLQLSDEQLQQAELGVINARYRQIRSRAALLVAMGKNIIKINEEEK